MTACFSRLPSRVLLFWVFRRSFVLLCGACVQVLREAVESTTITKEGLKLKQISLTDFKVKGSDAAGAGAAMLLLSARFVSCIASFKRVDGSTFAAPASTELSPHGSNKCVGHAGCGACNR